jgi:histidinol-phosphatase
LWDFAALEPIVSEAGGRITQFSGDPCADGGSCLTTNGVLHDTVLGLAAPHLRRTGTGGRSGGRPSAVD